ncbi:phosphoribosylanthranilate isomerase [Stanieria cyanosphaera PCC 7437]|uniref:N-(5'-phosphoribosyl)anthranilate isomerase n=1 Tax=Stanieria cyanosphaera (strain ATCC 29371 / PCC 7437) TaxID=111780 RepID=K9XRE3_STAC7|nr:phosphoribosylanthranilate isomerase [Stanieria cyanosphaera]AFZ34654.1 phosphoribosylanthranilate isomerase [Stanieria cyanosphaera PCC 7437]
MRVKICGITNLEQGNAIAQLGATELGFICVPASPRYLEVSAIKTIIQQLPQQVNTIGVFANLDLNAIVTIVSETGLTGVQLHGNESPEFCQQLRTLLSPQVELIKALRIKTNASLAKVIDYAQSVNTLLLDAYDPQLLGGTGHTLNWKELTQWTSPLPWFLAGGLTPDNILVALSQLQPHGIDLSSGVELAPGNKDLNKVTQLFHQLDSIKGKSSSFI